MKKIFNETAFIDFILASPENTFPVDESVLTSEPVLFDYIDTLKQLMSSTLATVLGEEVDLDYSLCEDGCTVQPLKKGEEMPGTRHGNEYELVSYHFAYYASRAPSKQFFETQWQKIQAQVTQGTAASEWIEWYRGAQVAALPPKQQLEVLYQRLQDPDSWRQRFRLLADAAVQKVRLFPKQIRCNVQDPLDVDNILLGGASGTVNAYALPESFMADESVDSRAVSGGLDLDLSLMHAEGLKSAVEIFEGQGKQSGKAMFLKVIEDPACQSIINQGGACEGMNSLAVAIFLRQALAKKGVNRQVIFVDPKSRQQMMWDPKEEKPKPFDKGKLKPHALYYFGPPDTRGTDFPIPAGYAAFVVGKTTNEEQRQQAIMRLRQFGRGQQVKIYMHKSIQQSLNAKLTRDTAHPITLAEWNNEVKLRSVERNSQSNSKSAARKARAPLLRQVKKVWFKPRIQNENAYWKMDLKSPDDILRLLTDIAADVALDKAFSPLFTHEREPTFRTHLKPTVYVKSVDELNTAYTNAQAEAQTLAKTFESISSGVDVLEKLKPIFPYPITKVEAKEAEMIVEKALQEKQPVELTPLFERWDIQSMVVGHLPQLPKDTIDALAGLLTMNAQGNGIWGALSGGFTFAKAKWFNEEQQTRAEVTQRLTSMSTVDFVQLIQNIPQIRDPLLEHFRQKINEVGPEGIFVVLVESGLAQYPIHPDTGAWLQTVQQELNLISGKVQQAQTQFNAEEIATQKHSKNLKKTVPASEDNDSHDQEQVQQNQQQQTKSAQMEQLKKSSGTAVDTSFRWTDWVTPYHGTRLVEKSTAALKSLLDGNDRNFISLDAAAERLSGHNGSYGFSPLARISVNCLALIETRMKLGGNSGNTMDRIAVFADQGTIRTVAIDQMDHEKGFTPGITQWRLDNNPPFQVEVHSMHSAFNDSKVGSTELLEMAGTPIDRKKLLTQLVQQKVMCGALYFSEEEKPPLQDWLTGLTSSERASLAYLVSKLHKVDNVSQLPGWVTTPLALYL